MKLELKHLSAYLPFRLSVCIMGEFSEEERKPFVFELVGLDVNFAEYHEVGRSVTEQAFFSDCFPILRPLSDLTKEIKVNGEKFIPLYNLGYDSEYEIKFYEDGCYFVIYRNGIHCICSQGEMIQKLLSWHFDIFGLLENELAIDLSTLKK